MKDKFHIDDQTLAAFVDDELDVTRAAMVLAAMEKDDSVRNQVYRLRRAKDLMRLGFGDASPPPNLGRSPRTLGWKQSGLRIAASLVVIVICASTGLLGYRIGVSAQNAGIAAPVSVHNDRIILHVNEADLKQYAAALDYADKFLAEHDAKNNRIAIVAQRDGINFMRAGVSPYEDRIRRMIAAHKNIDFIACANAIRELRMQGIEPMILDHVESRKPAVDQIVERLQAGWTYIKVQSLVTGSGMRG